MDIPTSYMFVLGSVEWSTYIQNVHLIFNEPYLAFDRHMGTYVCVNSKIYNVLCKYFTKKINPE